MLAQQRQELILDAVRTTGGRRVPQLVDTRGVRHVGAPRHRGAGRPGPGHPRAQRGDARRQQLDESGFAAKSVLHTAAKQAIATAAGLHGMDAEAGFTTPNLAEEETNRALVASARRVTDAGLEPVAQATLQDSCGRLVLAS